MNLKNTKVYSLDEEVIRKYAELCGAILIMDHERYSRAVGYYICNGISAECFIKGGATDEDSNRRVITPEEINALYDERFYQTETPEEKEVFEAMEAVTNQSKSVEWDGEGLPPVGVECEKLFNGESKIITPLYYDDHKSGVVMFYYINSGKSVATDYAWCLVENCILRKPETEAERKERERTEAAYDLFCCVTGNLNGYNFEDFCNNPYTGMWFKIVDKTGYKKEK